MRISYAEDTLLSIIAAFIGHIHSHHIHSHPSSHSTLIEMTRETIDAVRTLLTAVETVGCNTCIRSKRPKEIENLHVAKDHLYDVAGQLVESAEIVANAPFEEVVEEGYEKEKAGLLGAATGTLRAGTECVRLVRICVPEDETIYFNATPKQNAPTASSGRQLTPRINFDNPVVERDRTVGVRGSHTLSSLHRKATSLDHLQKRFMEDGGMVQGQFYGARQNEPRQEEEEEEEEVIDDKEEDMTVRPSQGVIFPVNYSSPIGFEHVTNITSIAKPRSLLARNPNVSHPPSPSSVWRTPPWFLRNRASRSQNSFNESLNFAYPSHWAYGSPFTFQICRFGQVYER